MERETTASTRLVPMSEDEYATYLEAAIPCYARDKVESGQWTEAEALKRSRDGYAELLPQGIATPDHFLQTLRDAATGTTVGMLWYACQEQGGRKVAYVYDVLVHPDHQRLGHATRAFRLLEQEVRQRGMSGIALHVFGHNAGAQNLYEQLGFNATNINMFKAVGHSGVGGCITEGEKSGFLRSTTPGTSPPPGGILNTEAPVQRQLDAYNAHDIERFAAEYTEDVQVFRPPAVEPVLSGKVAFAEHYAKNRFTNPALHATVVNRMVTGNIVVDHERVVGIGAEAVEAIAVYEIDGALIKTVWFF